jgi:predicted amidohydrolase
MRVGAVSLCSRRGEDDSNLERTIVFGEEAAEAGCRIIVFPEFSVCGPWVTYDKDAVPADLEGRAEGPDGRVVAQSQGHDESLVVVDV